MSNFMSKHDPGGVLKNAHDESTDSIRTTLTSTTLDLSHTDDSISLGNGTDLYTSTTVGTNIALDVNNIGDVINTDFKGGAVTINDSTETEMKVAGSALVGRKYVKITNLSSGLIYVGPTGVTVANGDPVYQNGYIVFDHGDSGTVAIFAIGDAGVTGSVRVQEAS